jgi:hypothetical protein
MELVTNISVELVLRIAVATFFETSTTRLHDVIIQMKNIFVNNNICVFVSEKVGVTIVHPGLKYRPNLLFLSS